MSGSGAKEEDPADAFQYMDIAPAFREQVSKYGTDRVALPLGGSALVLVYRRDAFSRQANRDAAAAAGITLEPPETWPQLDALARFFQRERLERRRDRRSRDLAAVLGPDREGLGDSTFLARAASLGQHRDQFSFLFDSDSMTPRIDSPPFVEALRGVIGLESLGPGRDRGL